METPHPTTDAAAATESTADITRVTAVPETTPAPSPLIPPVTQTHRKSRHVTSLTARQRMATMYLAEGWLLKNVAKELKIRRETVSRWQNLPLFQAAYERAIEENKRKYIKKREEMRENLRHEVTQLMNDAIDTVHSQLRNWQDSELADRAQLALNVLKFLKADRLCAPATAATSPEKLK